MTLAFEDANSKFLNVVSVADFDAKECVDDSLVEILKLMFCRDFEPEYLSRFEGEVLSRFLSKFLVKTFDLNFCF